MNPSKYENLVILKYFAGFVFSLINIYLQLIQNEWLFIALNLSIFTVG